MSSVPLYFLAELEKISKEKEPRGGVSQPAAIAGVLGTSYVSGRVTSAGQSAARKATGAGKRTRKVILEDDSRTLAYEKLRRYARRKGVTVRNRTMNFDEYLKHLPAHRHRAAYKNRAKIERKLRFGGPSYSPKIKTVFMAGSKSAPVLAHELGHATGSRWVRSRPIALGAAGTSLGAGLVGIKDLYQGLRSGDAKKRDKHLSQARNLTLIGGAAAVAPTLIEEARASKRAIQIMGKGHRRKTFKKLLPPYLTYANKNLPIALGGGITIEALRRALKPREKSK